MAKKNEAKIEIDLSGLVEKQRLSNEVRIIDAALMHYGIHGEISMDDITVGRERVKNYSMKIYTVRYKGLLMYRRYQLDMEGLKFRYESPIFNNLNEPVKS